jgi:TolB-like protein/Tfp pilus assembly protein PilF
MPEVRRLAAIMFTDIVGYTALMGKDERKAHELIRKNRKIHKTLIKKYNGTWLKEMGDGILASFSAATSAVSCAIAIQQISKKESIPLRIGIHEGEVLFEGKDVLGDGVNIASRLQEATEPGCISISGTVFTDVKNKPEIEAQFVDERAFKNVEEPVKVYKVIFQEDAGPDLYLIEESIQKKPKWKPLYFILAGLLVIIAMMLFLLPKLITKSSIDLEKSIAVLPFKSLSQDPEKQYMADGVQNAILNHLAKLGELEVVSRIAVEKYRDKPADPREVGNDLNVSYLLVGSFQIIENEVRLIVQLINTNNGRHIWSDEYVREWKNIFKVQSEIAETIAEELSIIITPQEKQIIETIPTTNLDAYDFYLRASNEHQNWWVKQSNTYLLDKAIRLYNNALKIDTTYADAYAGLGLAFFDKYIFQAHRTAHASPYMDSILFLANKALSFDDQLGEAYFLRGIYYEYKGANAQKALEEMNLALSYDPNHYRAYFEKGSLLRVYFGKNKESLMCLHHAINRKPGIETQELFDALARTYAQVGFYDKAMHYFQEYYKLTGSPANYFGLLAFLESSYGNYEKAIEYREKAIKSDSALTRGDYIGLAHTYQFLGQHEKAHKYFLKEVDILKEKGQRNTSHRIAYSYWMNGNKEEGKRIFGNAIDDNLKHIKQNSPVATQKAAHYDLALIYSVLGEKEKAYQYLEEFKKRPGYPQWWVTYLKYDPMFESIRDEPRYQQIVQHVEEKFQEEHEKVRAWLEEEGML